MKYFAIVGALISVITVQAFSSKVHGQVNDHFGFKLFNDWGDFSLYVKNDLETVNRSDIKWNTHTQQLGSFLFPGQVKIFIGGERTAISSLCNESCEPQSIKIEQGSTIVFTYLENAPITIPGYGTVMNVTLMASKVYNSDANKIISTIINKLSNESVGKFWGDYVGHTNPVSGDTSKFLWDKITVIWSKTKEKQTYFFTEEIDLTRIYYSHVKLLAYIPANLKITKKPENDYLYSIENGEIIKKMTTFTTNTGQKNKCMMEFKPVFTSDRVFELIQTSKNSLDNIKLIEKYALIDILKKLNYANINLVLDPNLAHK